MQDIVSVSVIIPSYNSAQTIGYTIDHLLSQSAFDQMKEIIIVDSSDDNLTVKNIKQYNHPKIHFYTSGFRVMPAIQRNIGAKHATGDILAFIDSDAYPEHNWVEKIIEAFRSGWKTGGGSYAVPEFQLKNKTALGQYYLEFNEFINAGTCHTVRLLPSCNLFCDRNLFHQVGGFPEIRASEDSLFGLKVNRISPLIFLPQAIVYHIFRENKKHSLHNQSLIGKYIFIYRKAFYKSLYLGDCLPVFIPLIISAKFLRIVFRIMKAGPFHFINFVKSFPVFMSGLYFWIKGFMNSRKDVKLVEDLKMSITVYLNS
jgi:glycosyltransferase involved in cell wall biosynthesis